MIGYSQSKNTGIINGNNYYKILIFGLTKLTYLSQTKKRI